MPAPSSLRIGGSLLLSFLSLGPNGLVLHHYVGLLSHVRSWEGVQSSWQTPLGAFLQATAPLVSTIVACLIGVSLFVAWGAGRLVRDRTRLDPIGWAASAARFANLALILGGLNAVGLIGLLAHRAYLLAW